MPTIPQVKVLTNTSVEVLNVIRNNASQDYRNYIPVATPDAEVIKEIGAILMDYPVLQNEFLSALVNRVGKVLVASKSYDNPWAVFKRGTMEMGESIEEIFVNLANPQQFDPELAEEEVFKRVIPDVRSAFHVMNYQKMYKVTVTQDQLKQAFLSIEGVTNLIENIAKSMYTGANYDEFLMMRYLLALHILKGKMYFKEIAGVGSEAETKQAVIDIKALSNDLTFMSDDFNVAGVKTHTPKDEQYIIMNTAFDANVDVNVLAAAFNLSYAEFIGHRIISPRFGDLDLDRLDVLLAANPNYERLTEAQCAKLNSVGYVIVDKNFFMILDNLNKYTEIYNPQGLYWNYFYHVWKTFSVSPFANAICGVVGENTITGNVNAADLTINGTALSDFTDDNPLAVGEYIVGNETGVAANVLLTSDNPDIVIINGNKIVIASGASGPYNITQHNADGTTSTVEIYVG